MITTIAVNVLNIYSYRTLFYGPKFTYGTIKYY